MGEVTAEAVLFDLDGTLLDTIDDLARCMNRSLAACGLPPVAAPKHKLMVGDGVRNYVLRAMPADGRGDEALVRRITGVYQGLYQDGWAERTRPYEGVPELLGRLGRRGLRLAVLSNKPDRFTREMVRHFLPQAQFELVCGAVDGVPLKPDPASALTVARSMGLAAGRFAYVGDTATDMRTARSAGMRAVGALWGFRSREELEGAGAEVLLERPCDLADLLGA